MEINKNHISNSPFIFGNRNRVNYSSEKETIDWDRVSEELMSLLTKLPQKSS